MLPTHWLSLAVSLLIFVVQLVVQLVIIYYKFVDQLVIRGGEMGNPLSNVQRWGYLAS